MQIYHQLEVNTKSNVYPIIIGENLLININDLDIIKNIKPSKVLIISDEYVASLYLDVLKKEIAKKFAVESFVVNAGEKSKSFSNFEQIISFMLENNFDRKSLIMTLGGGVVGDLGGFVAASFMRGIPFIQLPTTILAHDSSVGGKVAINHPLSKNSIGAFYQPQAVIYDISTFKTLNKQEILSGIAEILKHGFIKSPSLIEWIIKNHRNIADLETESVAQLIADSCQVKIDIVSEDEREQGIRAYLNFGHTVGHGIEAAMGYGQIPHGIAVAIGMVTAAIIGVNRGLTGESVLNKIVESNLAVSLPIHLPGSLDYQDIIKYIYKDKKNKDGEITFILLEDIGQARIVSGITAEEILLAFAHQASL